jgi:hypothetical protein
LNLVLINQYIAQIPELVADAIFGNVGTMVSFRVGATDADKLVKEFAPVFDANDMVNLPNYQIYTKMAIDGVTSQAFSAHTLPPKGVVNDNAEQIITWSRETYSRDRTAVENDINARAQADLRLETEKQYDSMRQIPYVVDGTLYKEFSAKGGQRWYFGQPEEVLTQEEHETVQSVQQETAKTQGTQRENPPGTEANLPVLITPQLPAAPVNTELIEVKQNDENKLPSSELAEEELSPSQKKRRRKKKRREEMAALAKTEMISALGERSEAVTPVTPLSEPVHEPSLVLQPEVGESSRREFSDNPPASSPVDAPVTPQQLAVVPLPQVSQEDRGGEEITIPEQNELTLERMVNRGHQHDDWLPIDEIGDDG